MDGHIIKESKSIKRYKRKDGTIVEKEYVQKYVVLDREGVITQTQVIEKIRGATQEQLKIIYDFLTKKEDVALGPVEEQIIKHHTVDNPAQAQ